MTINKIRIENIKGISSRTFELNIIPNCPSLLVAPNGFGKSSFAASFLSLQANKLSVHEDNNHRNDANLNSKLIIEFTDRHNTIHTIEANDTTNEITNHFDYFVINNQIRAKGIGKNFSGRTVVSASISVEPVTLLNTIPNQVNFDYSYSKQQQAFGQNGKVLPNIKTLFRNQKFIFELSQHYSTLDRIFLVGSQKTINQVIAALNTRSGTKDVLKQWLMNNKLCELESIAPLKEIAELVLASNLADDSRDSAYLSAIQISNLYFLDKTKFKNACKFSNYEFEKNGYTEMLAAFNTSWCRIIPKEKGGKLIVEFPKANQISNGQRDVITFVALLHRAQRKLKGQNSILIIDEVFDYLDDANLVAVQYYITKLIDNYKKSDRKIYPLILTHLNPYYFKNFAFSKQKIYYLDKRNMLPNESMVNLLKKRNELSIKDEVSKYLFHYHFNQINKREEFKTLKLRELWGEGNNFNVFIRDEMQKYIDNNGDFDPLAVCCALRKKVEEITFNQIVSNTDRNAFLDQHKTRDKLLFAEEKGIEVPEYFYLLGLIYNDGMHWREGQDNISCISSDLI